MTSAEEVDAAIPAHDLVKLDRKLSQAVSRQRGIKLSADELELMALVGSLRLLSTARTDALTQLARERRADRR